MARKVYIDGHVGTTGLRIRQWLAGRDDLALVTVSYTHLTLPTKRIV